MPAICGVQAGKKYYTAMCPISFLAELFKYEDPTLTPSMKYQRVLNKSRIPEMRDYVLKGDYTFSALTASIDGKFNFIQYNKDNDTPAGTLRIDAQARIIINDGQHRREALLAALRINEELKNEHIVIVFYKADGLVQAQQIFSDLNKHAVKPTKSLNILFDNREGFSKIVREIIESVDGFKGRIEPEKTTISNRSKNLYTLNGVYESAVSLTHNTVLQGESLKKYIVDFFSHACSNITEWQKVIKGEIQPIDYRADYITAHTIFIKALGKVGNALLVKYPDDALKKLDRLKKVNLRKDNKDLQDIGIITNRLKINGVANCVKLLANYILKQIGEEEIC
jgi:DNA sulfur modification protein DndB